LTGAAGDIGRAVALVLGARGWRLALTDHPSAAERLDGVAGECRAAGADAWTATFDVCDAAGATEAVGACVREFGPPAALFNNAGVQGSFQPIHRYPLDEVAKVVGVNLEGVIIVLGVVSAAMVAAGHDGAIVNTASMAGVTGAPNMPVYSATKSAVIGLTAAAAKDLAPHGIRVNAVSPGFIGPGVMWDTQVAAQAAADTQYFPPDRDVVAAQMLGSIPLRRQGTLDEVARVVAFLLSDESSYVTGSNIEIAGGAA
jgi:NAD(P)-dependent dehydrogenase (short-subunit alcohol dehydrogenase family)